MSAPESSPEWWLMFRRIVTYLLGVTVILDSLRNGKTAELLIGLLMVGVLPIDDLLRMMQLRRSARTTGRSVPPEPSRSNADETLPEPRTRPNEDGPV